MPKYITHWILAEKVYLNMDADSAMKKIIKPHKNIYMAGAVILDTPFYLLYGRDGKRMNQLAEGVHDTVSNSYRILVEMLKSYKDITPDEVMALLLGIITHIHADAVFHPFVYYFSGTGVSDKKERERHHILECYMDLYLKHEFKHPVPELFSDVMRNIEMKKAKFLEALSNLFSVDLRTDPNSLSKAVRMNALLQGLFDKNLLRMILEMLNHLPGVNLIDYISHFYPHPKPDPKTLFPHEFEYRNPVTGEKKSGSVMALAEQTIQRIEEIFYFIENHCKKKSLSEVFLNLTGPNLYTGLNEAQKKDMRFFNTEKDIMELILG